MIDFHCVRSAYLRPAYDEWPVKEVKPLLLEQEHVVFSYQPDPKKGDQSCYAVFTNKRLFVNESYSQVSSDYELTSLPYNKVQRFSTSTDNDGITLRLHFANGDEAIVEILGVRGESRAKNRTVLDEICRMIAKEIM